ncbi:hypothetical protein RW1_052_00230 [Rhodococcus wratislaviensis NBRC 100605]|uniref:Uncharacterized protein n=1 Tax=Rhodococcus wratislaviensis NBRC 100605 TaxID=1219028 RepID=X0QBK1_RHOWR|nr:hypothetical protein [Rhodococcus wratislaviensis]GAF48316.1 hypothetical protein RW1_052_00230 [Rhodococcus wratislaviensis NBRC 100605]
MDLPRHFYQDGPAFEDIPLERLSGPGVTLQIGIEPGGVIPLTTSTAPPKGFGQLTSSASTPAEQPGWAPTPTCCNTRASISMPPNGSSTRRQELAVDFATPDLPTYQRTARFDWPIRRYLLRHGVLITEHLKPTTGLAGRHAEFIFRP